MPQSLHPNTSKTDYHIHTEYSYDSSITGAELLAKAIERNYRAVAITEHLDLLPQELGYFGLKSLTEYRKSIFQLREQFPQIYLYLGLEIGDYHLVKSFAQSLLDMYQFDLILGSVHFLSDHTNIAVKHPTPLSPTQIRDYYKQNLSLVSNCNIDVLSHLGVYKRFYDCRPDESNSIDIIKELFTVMIAKNIALEINYSCYRKPYRRLIPEEDQLELYYNMGGRLVTIGSDSHHIDHFDDHFDTALSWIISDHFTILPVTYK